MLSDFETLVTDLIRDDAARIDTAGKDRAIQLAVQRYSKDRERVKVEDVATTAANTLPLPPAWETDFSDLRTLEYPIGEVPPSVIASDRYGFYRSTSALVVQLLDALNIGSTVRVTYTIAHAVSDVLDTIPVADREPVACWAAAGLCDEIASFYSGGTDSTIQADSAPGQSKAQEYSRRAATLRKRYFNELGLEDKRSAPAGTVVTLRPTDSRGQERLTHPLRGSRY